MYQTVSMKLSLGSSCEIVAHRIVGTKARATASSIRRAQTDAGSGSVDGHCVRSKREHCLESASARIALRLWSSMLAPAGGLVGCLVLVAHPGNAVDRVTPSWPTRHGVRHRRQLFCSRYARGEKNDRSPTVRKLRSTHHIFVDAQCIPLALNLSDAKYDDTRQLESPVGAIPPSRCKRGPPLRYPKTRPGNIGITV